MGVKDSQDAIIFRGENVAIGEEKAFGVIRSLLFKQKIGTLSPLEKQTLLTIRRFIGEEQF